MSDLITLVGTIVDHEGATPLEGARITATPSQRVTQTSDGKEALSDASATTDETGAFSLALVYAEGLRYTIVYRAGGERLMRGVLDCDSYTAGATVDVADLPPIAGVPPSAVETLQAWFLAQLEALGGDASPEGIQDVVGAMIVAAGGTYDDEAGTITLPSSGGDTTAQVGTFDLPESPTEGQTVSILADEGTVIPEGITWDSGGEPTVTGRLLIACVWSGVDWVCTYGLPIAAAPELPDVTGPNAGTLGIVVSSTTADGTVTGATDETALDAAPYSFRVDAGTWTAWQAGATYEWTGLTAETAYDFQHRVRDAAGNITEGSVVTDTTDPAPVDSTPPTPGTLASSAITDTSFTLTVSGASDETLLAPLPYAFSTDNGSTWSAYQAGATFDASGLTAETEYTCVHRVRDAAGNVATGSSIVVETGAASGAPLAGGTETTSGGYVYHTFTESGTLTVNNPTEVEYLVVAGGGGGGNVLSNVAGGGGGAGGVRFGTVNLTETLAVTVGAGGAGGAQGGTSSLGSLVSCAGGGYGSPVESNAPSNGGTGGSGGGGIGAGTPGTGGAGTSGEGFAGGNGNPGGGAGGSRTAGGGGGASEVGANATSTSGGDGGDGIEWPASSGTYYGGGGGGARNISATGVAGAGGLGGGAAGAATAADGNDATPNTGGGGGGAGATTSGSYAGGSGGSGVVIVRYPA